MDLLNKLIFQAARSCEVELYHHEWIGAGSKNILRVFIDKPGGVTIADCEKVSRELGVVLEAEDVIPVRYVLEVSSPGLDRKLYTPLHYRQNIGREVEVKLRREVQEPTRKWAGNLESVTEASFTIRVSDEQAKDIRFEDVEFTRLKVVF